VMSVREEEADFLCDVSAALSEAADRLEEAAHLAFLALDELKLAVKELEKVDAKKALELFLKHDILGIDLELSGGHAYKMLHYLREAEEGTRALQRTMEELARSIVLKTGGC